MKAGWAPVECLPCEKWEAKDKWKAAEKNIFVDLFREVSSKNSQFGGGGRVGNAQREWRTLCIQEKNAVELKFETMNQRM